METIEKITAEIRNNNSFIITTHEGPDGDAAGSSLALASFLRKTGKDVTVHCKDPFPSLYSFLPGANELQLHIPDRDFDVAFVMDIGELKRAGKEFCSFGRIGKIINLDHHLTCENFGLYNLIDKDAAATAILVHRIIDSCGYEIDFETALCIYVGVMTDTGSFRYSNSNVEAFTVAGKMIGAGVNAWHVAEKIYENQPLKRLDLLCLALSTLETKANGLVASIEVTLDMYEKSGGDAELTDGFINYPRSVQGVEVAILFRQLEPERYKIGFRSKGKVNVAAFSEALGGGGHHNAAGCILDGSISDVKTFVYSIVEKNLC